MGNAPSPELRKDLLDQHEASVLKAAQKIATADVLLLCTGAGFSADSGLAVYADVARVPAYAARNLKYHDICSPCWLKREPELFWGFWGQCFNDYRNTSPHEGYEIISSWADRHFRNSDFADAVRQRCEGRRKVKVQEAEAEGMAESCRKEDDAGMPYVVNDLPGAFFAFTSNVDAHHFDWFAASEIRECHGNTELYQCSSRCGKRNVWRAPLDFRFHVDKNTMLAPSGQTAPASQCIACEGTGTVLQEPCSLCDGLGGFDDENEDQGPGMPAANTPRIGQVRGGGRPFALRHMPGRPPEANTTGFTKNHPFCPHCGGPARPAILMFGDSRWQDCVEQERRWQTWSVAVKDEIKHRRGDVRVVIVELGAGCNVPTVRCTSEEKLRIWHEAGAQACLVRVNPDFPCGDRSPFSPGSELAGLVVSIMARGLPTLTQINDVMSKQSFDKAEAWKIEKALDLPDCVGADEWSEMTMAFEAKAEGGQEISFEDAYKIMIRDDERGEYSEAEFIDDVKTLKKMDARDDWASSEVLTLPEMKRFFSMFA